MTNKPHKEHAKNLINKLKHIHIPVNPYSLPI